MEKPKDIFHQLVVVFVLTLALVFLARGFHSVHTGVFEGSTQAGPYRLQGLAAVFMGWANVLSSLAYLSAVAFLLKAPSVVSRSLLGLGLVGAIGFYGWSLAVR